MKKHPSFSEFQCQTDFVSQSCEALYLRDCDLAAMRQDAGNQSPDMHTLVIIIRNPGGNSYTA